MTPHQALERELSANAAALRALARDLVGKSDADDLVQETALHALRSPPREPEGLGAWLATILRRLASNHRRDRQRREQRERATPPREPDPATAAELERREILRRTTLAVFSLAEPYQTTLLLRYFEDLSPTAIARRTGVPVATVKTRLQRGLVQLRQALDREHRDRDWRRALLLTTGYRASTGVLTLATWTLLMTNTAKLTIAASLMAGALLWWQLAGSQVAPPPAQRSELPATATATAATAPSETDASAPAREEVTRHDAFAGTDLAHPHEYRLRFVLTDRFGLPVEGRTVYFAPMGCTLNAWPHESDRDGVVLVTWSARAASQHVAVAVDSAGIGGLREIEVTAGHERTVAMLAESGHGRGRITFGQYRAVGGSSAAENGMHYLGTVTRRAAATLVAREGLHPHARIGDRLLTEGAAILAGLRNKQADVVRLAFDVAILEELETKPAPTRGVVTGTVFGEDGTAVAGTTVDCCRERDRSIQRTRTDKNGVYRFEGLSEGSLEIRAGGDAHGLGRAPCHVNPTATVSADVYLRREATIRGVAVGPGGEPLTKHRVLYASTGLPCRDETTTADDGSFVLANVQGGAGKLFLLPPNSELPIAILDAVLPNTGPVSLDLRELPAPTGVIRTQLLLPDEVEHMDLTSFEVRIWQADSARGTNLEPDNEGKLEVTGLRPGFYRVAVGGPHVGWMDLGQHYVSGDGAVDLGTRQLPRPGTVRLLEPQRSRTLELYHRRPHGDVRAEEDPGFGEREQAILPPGKWLIFWRDGEKGARHVREFEIRRGEVTELALPPVPK